MPKLTDLWKKGTVAPLSDDIPEGGLAIDVANKKAYSRGNDGNIFEIGGGFQGVHNDLSGRDDADAHPISSISGLQGELDGKLDDPGNPTYTRTTLLFNPDGTRILDKLNADDVGAAWEDHGHKINEVEDLQTELNNRYLKSAFIDESTGTPDAGKPIVLDINGKISTTMLDASSFYYVGPHDPSAGTEYPDTTGESTGAFWHVNELSAPTGTDPEPYYEFTSGDLAGKQITVGDFMVWGSAGWGIMSSEMNPSLYYKLDGSQAITGPFAGGGQKIANIADGTEDTDGSTVGQLNAGLAGKADTVHDHTVSDITDWPATFPPESHMHEIADVNGLQGALDAKANDADIDIGVY